MHTNVVRKVIVRKEIVKTQVLLRPQIVVFMFLFVYELNKQDILSFRGDGKYISFYFGQSQASCLPPASWWYF